MSEFPPVGVFGTWDAPATDDGVPIPVPETKGCLHCREAFKADDNGAVMPSGYATHRECALRSVMGGIGHLVNHRRYCVDRGCPDAGLSYRQSALLVWRLWVDHLPVTEEHLDAARVG